MKQVTKAESPGECKLLLLWQHSTKNNFNAISVGKIFRNSEKSLIVGHEDGIVRVYPLPGTGTGKQVTLKSSLSLETKSGPIQTMVLRDVTKLNSNDLTVADSRGMVTVFSNGQILARRSISEHCIQCLKIQHDALGLNAIIVGDQHGHVTAFSPFSDFWRIRLTDASPYKGLTVTPNVTSLHIATLTDSCGQRRSFIVVADTCKHLHIIYSGSIVTTLTTPDVVTAMASGKFIDSEDIESAPGADQSALDTQIALGTDTGAIFIMAHFQVYTEEFSNIHQTITSLETLPAADSQSTDTLLCGGHFDALHVLRHGKMAKYKTPAWVNSIVTGDINNDGVQEVVFGCHDNSVHGLQIQFS